MLALKRRDPLTQRPGHLDDHLTTPSWPSFGEVREILPSYRPAKKPSIIPRLLHGNSRPDLQPSTKPYHTFEDVWSHTGYIPYIPYQAGLALVIGLPIDLQIHLDVSSRSTRDPRASGRSSTWLPLKVDSEHRPLFSVSRTLLS